MPKRRSLPGGLSQEQLAGIFARELDRHSDRTIEELRSLFAREVEKTVERLDVELFETDLTDDGVPLRLNVCGYFDGTNKRVDSNDPTLFSGRVLPLCEHVEPLPHVPAEHYDAGVVRELLARVALRWFAECWWKAGGWDYALPAEIRGHDDIGGDGFVLTRHAAR